MSLPEIPKSLIPFLQEYLPKDVPDRTVVTLTYAQSLDSRIAAKKGEQTKISHIETKTMTHYIRSKHDAILVGVGTVLADDPKLNCRFRIPGEAASHPRPIILDPHGKWAYSGSQLRQIAATKQGKAPFILIDNTTAIDPREQQALEDQGGRFVKLRFDNKDSPVKNWDLILQKLNDLGIGSVMIEGGATIINDLLTAPKLVDSLIITIGPTFLGKEGVEVSPISQVSLKEPKWWQGTQDVVLCARLNLFYTSI
ncbi:Piso0_001534 [Millerozyma farinosa CBS 7064]|uniref:2,5-diamino-6-ribosylamino-4(3H)-pyrimidinone 5'-phosphate reductase n=1 Tax=Pichia sorbitophila (strain ATCC MYA-4447 / BCRC 22081 / CBS 7064 / NBRC 10061 / NRRL Y-12695) TaxID=559304 RepID=G8YNF1_PICSO|nr:Piso0_001534 [Millerozyma farinosa CBS 7064]